MTVRAATDRPNIILINCDDLGYGDLGCYGYPCNSTPNLDRLAAEGMRFTDFYMASSVCSPSRGAMLTGCYPQRIGFGRFDRGHVLFPGDAEGLHPDERTVADLLKRRGYATQIVGKWHCGDQPEFLPTRHGFDHYFGIPYSNDMGRQRNRTGRPPLPLLQDESVVQQQPDQAALTERYVAVCREFIRANAERPFFLYLAHMYVHLPIYAPEGFMQASKNGRYGAGVACMDWSVGVLMRTLEELGLRENTLIVFTSDNGSRGRDEGGSNGPLRGWKTTSWEGGFRVPGIFCWPGQIPAGSTCSEMAVAFDLLPTFVKFAGGDLPRDRVLDGRDLAPLLLDAPDARSPHEAFFYYRGNSLNAVRSGKWKLFVSRTPRGNEVEKVLELYDLENDVGETTDLHESHPEVVAKLQVLMETCREQLGDDVQGVKGRNIRSIGRVENPRPLTEYDSSYPYICAEYDLSDAG